MQMNFFKITGWWYGCPTVKGTIDFKIKIPKHRDKEVKTSKQRKMNLDMHLAVYYY